MTGLLYKELKYYWVFVFCTVLIPVLVLLVLPLAMAYSHDDMNILTKSGTQSVFMLIVTFIASGFTQGMLFNNTDARKAWAMWVASTPEGIKGYLRIKYELTFGLILTTLWSVQICDFIMGMVNSSYGLDYESPVSFIIIISYLQMISRAVELPFTVRFGAKNGSIIKSIFFAAIAISVIALFTLCGENIVSVVMEHDTTMLSTGANILISILPIISLVLYYLSYRLSCGLFMKGVEQYDS